MKPKKRFSKLTAWLLTLAMLMTFIPSFTLGVSAAEITPSQPAGDGSADNPYQITTAEELYWFAEAVNDGNTTICADLMNNITVNTGVVNAEGSLSANAANFTAWTPIGHQTGVSNNNYAFKGTFDGKGHTISGLYFDSSIHSDLTKLNSQAYKGLFGYVGGATIKNVTVADSYFYGTQQVGGIVGQAGYSGVSPNPQIINCHVVNSSINGTSNVGGIVGFVRNSVLIESCTNAGYVTGKYDTWNNAPGFIGGIVGYLAVDSTVTDCHNIAVVSSADKYVGGVVGVTAGTVTVQKSSNTGTVSGTNYVSGVVGYVNNGSVSITDCYNAGAVTATSDPGYARGIIYDSGSSVGNCFNYGSVTGTNVAAIASSTNSSNCYYLDSIGLSDTNATAKSATDFANGTVMDLLNAGRTGSEVVWVQGENSPVFKPKHQHDYIYTANENVITEACDCGHSETATITAPENPSYDGTAKEATVTYSDNWQGGELTISYGVGGNINAGIVTAVIEKDDATASVEYEIKPPEAKWGTSKESLTNVGTLANAIAAAQSDSSIKYILMIDDVSVQGLVIDGGEFTLDMGGNTLECESQISIYDGKIVFKNGTFENNWNYAIWVDGDKDTTEITFESGNYSAYGSVVYIREAKQLTVMKDVTMQSDIPIYIGSSCAASLIQGATLSGSAWDITCTSDGDNKITEGIYDFDFRYGSLDLTNHPDPTGITIVDFDSSMWGAPLYIDGIKLPEGYGLFDIRGVQHTEMGTTYPGMLTVKPLHQHNYTYTASNNVITETCTCGHSETATITAPENLIYDGTAKEATVSYSSDNWQGGELTIAYSESGNTDAGSVTATIEKGGATASVVYEIKKVKIEKPTEDTTEFVYDGSEHTYVVAESDKYDISDNKRTSAGTQTVRVTLNNKTNFEWTDGTTDDITFDFIVNKKPIEIVWGTTEFVYDGNEKTVTAEVSNAVSGDIVNLTVTGNKATNVGDYTAEVTGLDNANYTLEGVTTTKAWSISQSGTIFADKKVLKDGVETNSFIYGDTITVKVKPQATGTAPTTMMLMSVTPPDENQMALYIGETQVSDAAAADDDGYYTMTIDTTEAGLEYGEITLTAKYVGNANMANYAENVTLTLAKADATLGSAPTAISDLIYNREEQTLIHAGSEVTGGTLMYKLNDGEYSEELPKATDADTYTVFYKVFGDSNHNDTAEQRFPVTIAEKTINPAISLTAPVANVAPQTTIETDEYTATVVWSPEVTDKFAYSTAYTATITLAPKANYTVTGITENGYTASGAESVTNTADSGDITVVYAETGRRPSSGGGTTRYTVKFDTDSGSNVTSKTVTRNSKVAEPTAPTKDGYKFDGWYTDKELTTAYDFDTKVTKNFTLYAKWTEDKADDTDDKTDTPDTPVWENPFTDVNADDWYYENVEYAVENGLFNGTTETTFAPNEIITRAMMVTVLYRAEGEPTVTGTATFEDVDSNAYYAKAVIWGQQNGIIKGYSETEFAPDQNITREQIAAIMHRYAQYKGYDVSVGENTNILSYDDFDSISEYAIASMQYAVGSGLMKGKTTSTLNPLDNATRAEIAAILNRFIEANK